MILLKSTSEILEIVTSSTAGIDISATWVDVTTTTHSPSTTETKVTTATTTTIVAAPAASTQRQIKLITIRNIHASTSNTISVNKDISSTNYTVSPTITLLAGELYEYNGEEWVYYAADGTIKSGAAAAGNTGYISAGTTYGSLGTIVFSNSNGVSFGANGQTITATVATNYQSQGAYLTTAMLSNAATISNVNFSAGTTSNNLSNIVFSNSNGVSFGLNGSTVTAQHNAITTGRASNDAVGLNTAQTNVTWTVNSAGISLNAGGYLTTAMVSNAATISNINVSAGTTSNNLSAITFSNSNGISFGLNGSVVTAQHNAITTGRASNDGVGLNTAQTNVTWTVNSAGISLNAGGYLTTARASNDAIGLNTAQTNVTWTVNSSGISLNLAAHLTTAMLSNAATISNIKVSAGTLSALRSDVTFSNLNGVTFGLETNGIVTASVAAGGGGLTNINVSGGTTSNNLSNIVFSNSNGVSFGLNGSTMTASVGAAAGFTHSGYNPYADLVKVAGQVGNGTIIIDPVRFDNVVFDRILNNVNFTATSNLSGSMTASFWNGLYTKNVSTLSLLSSFSTSTNVTMSGTVGSYSLFSGIRNLSIPATMTITAGDYWLAVVSRTTTGGAAGMTLSQQLGSNIASVFAGQFGVAHNTTMQLTLGQGIYSVTSAGLPNSIGFNQIIGSNSEVRRAPFIIFANGTV